MKKYGFIFFLIFLVIGLSFFLDYYLISDLTFVLDPDNYDILEFISGNSDLIYVVFFIASLLLIHFSFFKNNLHKFYINSEICPQNNLTNKLQIRSPPC